jgi:glycosyltransferase involved in cell wall biosynthesis
LVSILISNYNYASYLEAAVASSIEQTYDRLEVVVCDDGSTDASSEILAQLQSRDSRIKVIYQENGGQALALNAAFLKCTGDIICLLDADDVFMPDKVKRVVDAFAAAPHCGLAVNRMLRVDRTRRYLGEVPLLSSLASGWTRPFLSLTAPHVAPGLPPSSGLSLRRHVAEVLFPLPAGLRAYADTLIQVLAPLLTPVVGIETPLSEYRFHGANVAAVSQFTENKLRNLVVYEREIWRAWRRFLASSWSGLPPDFHLPSEMPSSPMSYAYARLRSRSGTHSSARGISSVYLTTWPRAHQWYWRAASLMPNWLFRRSFALVYGQTPAKIVLGRLLGVLHSISLRSRVMGLVRRAVIGQAGVGTPRQADGRILTKSAARPSLRRVG